MSLLRGRRGVRPAGGRQELRGGFHAGWAREGASQLRPLGSKPCTPAGGRPVVDVSPQPRAVGGGGVPTRGHGAFKGPPGLEERWEVSLA